MANNHKVPGQFGEILVHPSINSKSQIYTYVDKQKYGDAVVQCELIRSGSCVSISIK